VHRYTHVYPSSLLLSPYASGALSSLNHKLLNLKCVTQNPQPQPLNFKPDNIFPYTLPKL